MTDDLDELRAELDGFARPEKKDGPSPKEERIIAGFEDIQRFVEQHRRAPQHGEDKDIFERLYAVRLDRLRALGECRILLARFDHQGLLSGAALAQADPVESMDDDALLAELEGVVARSDITELRHVRSQAEIHAAEEIANRERCEDFDRFQPLFEQAENDLKSGARQARLFGKDASVEKGNFFILGGQLVYVAEVGETIKAPNGENDARLHVIYANGTKSNLLRRSLQRALYKDEAGRRLTEPSAGPLFSDTWAESDIESGTIYVLRSLSDHSIVAQHRELIHKIGVTGGKVETRIANAAHDATYLLADVEVVATYRLVGINRTKLENLFHRIFAPAQLDLTIHDRFGHPVRPREWFLVPLHVIDEAVEHVRKGSIAEVVYDPKTARFSAPQPYSCSAAGDR
ncbi:GIY-YIG nuclease family protein [Verminephrobacter aporrectodeae subsp. tuberculatae]|uniref:GIY-YIG nuclease family protein n=1 Tax=Verminephrobacter aporrectodeae TaxID=1110389 RepID=UPI0022378B44|nr:GIY-YIG nuclease family protein [Verminephrobacter aporrectodeae]MCW5255848.1 GIY-YIG nuclease family protein [Verminephrobacter aporrectodeae subsp. tuberculatae]